MKSPWYLRNADLHCELLIDPVRTVIQNVALSHLERLRNHTNYEVSNLLIVSEEMRRLLRVRPLDLAH